MVKKMKSSTIQEFVEKNKNLHNEETKIVEDKQLDIVKEKDVNFQPVTKDMEIVKEEDKNEENVDTTEENKNEENVVEDNVVSDNMVEEKETEVNNNEEDEAIEDKTEDLGSIVEDKGEDEEIVSIDKGNKPKTMENKKTKVQKRKTYDEVFGYTWLGLKYGD